MIDWMSSKCNSLMNGYGVAAYGFDIEKTGDDAEVILEVSGEQTKHPARLGDVFGLLPEEIERRFAAACLAVGIEEQNHTLIRFADRMLDPDDTGKGLPSIYPFDNKE